MKIKTALLSGIALRYAVFLALRDMIVKKRSEVQWEDDTYWLLYDDGSIQHSVEVPSSSMNRRYNRTLFAPDENQWQGGDIIDEFRISTVWDGSCWIGSVWSPARQMWEHNHTSNKRMQAAMRAFVDYRLGSEVVLPDGVHCT